MSWVEDHRRSECPFTNAVKIYEDLQPSSTVARDENDFMKMRYITERHQREVEQTISPMPSSMLNIHNDTE